MPQAARSQSYLDGLLAAKTTACASRNSWHRASTPKATSAHFAIGLPFQTDGKVGQPDRSAGAVLDHAAQNITEQSSAPKGGSACLQIYRGRLPVLPDLRVEVDLLTLIEPREPGPLDSRDVDEYIGATIGGGDEPIALPAVESFHGAGHHNTILPDGRFWRAEQEARSCKIVDINRAARRMCIRLTLSQMKRPKPPSCGDPAPF
jgi:hypothetical protein